MKYIEIITVFVFSFALFSFVVYSWDADLIISMITQNPTVGTNVTAGAQKSHSDQTKFAQFIWISPNGTIAKTSPEIETTSGGGIDYANDSYIVDEVGTWNLTVRFLKQQGQEVAINFQVFTVVATCELSLQSSSFDFGPVQPGATSGTQSITVSNSGSVSVPVTINGTGWSGTSGTFDVSKTDFKCSSPTGTSTCAVSSFTSLSSSDQSFATIQNGYGVSGDFGVTIPADQAQGSYSQTITFTSTC